jgi:hypothetical protein
MAEQTRELSIRKMVLEIARQIQSEGGYPGVHQVSKRLKTLGISFFATARAIHRERANWPCEIKPSTPPTPWRIRKAIIDMNDAGHGSVTIAREVARRFGKTISRTTILDILRRSRKPRQNHWESASYRAEVEARIAEIRAEKIAREEENPCPRPVRIPRSRTCVDPDGRVTLSGSRRP